MTHRIPVVAIGLAVSLLASAGSAQSPPDTSGFVRVTPAQVHWADTPGGLGAQFATVLGDPSKPGLYVMRAKFPPHVMDSPHWHSQERYVTVLQGRWCTGTGPVFDVAKAVPLEAGGAMKHPAKGVHWDGSCGDAPVIVQITGLGPVTTEQVDPKAPQWRVVKP